MGYRITRDKADDVFSKYIRLRDMECRRCHSPVQINDKGLPVSHQASHFMSRRKESTRFNELNVDCLCGGCHQYFTANPIEHCEWQIKIKGLATVELIRLQSNLPKKKDRQMDLLYWNTRLKELL